MESKKANHRATHYIRLTQGYFVEIDAEDFEAIGKHKWYAKKNTSKDLPNGKYYAARGNRVNGKITTVYMHREIMDCPVDKEVGHINDNGLCNKRENLVVLTRKEHMNKVYC